MATRKTPEFDPTEYEQLMKQLEALRTAPEKPAEGPYFNAWNLGKKKQPGKHTICSSLPEELP